MLMAFLEEGEGDLLAALPVQNHLDPPPGDDEQRVPGFLLPEHQRVLRVVFQDNQIAQLVQSAVADVGEDRHAFE
jgi:hypothetical protein